MSACSTKLVPSGQPEFKPSKQDLERRQKFRVYSGDPRTTAELLDQIFADDDVDPEYLQSQKLKAMAMMCRNFQWNSSSEAAASGMRSQT